LKGEIAMEPSEKKLRVFAIVTFFAGAILLSLLLANESVSRVKTETPIADSSGIASTPSFQAIQAGDPGEAQPTGRTVALLPESGGSGPIPNDLPFGRNVRVWGDPNEQSRPALVVNATGAVYVAFQHFNGADWDVYITVSRDDGRTWAMPVALANTTANETNPSLAVTSTGSFALFYAQDAFPDRVYFFQSTDGVLWRQGSWSLSVKPGLSNAQFPSVAAQNPPGAYPDGIMVIVQVRCVHPTNCAGGSDTAYYVGSRFWSAWPPVFDLANWYWGAGMGGFPPQFLHPALSWSNTRLYQALENETVDGAQWRLVIFTMSANGNMLVGEYYSQANSTAGIYPHTATSGQVTIAAGAFMNATLFPSNPTSHNLLYFYSTNDGASFNSGVLDTSMTDQRSASIAGKGGEWHITYYSDSIMTHQYSLDSGATFSGPQKVSDNVGTAVNDDRTTSVYFGKDGAPKMAWQDNRGGNVDVYFATNLTYQFWINASCGGQDAKLTVIIDGANYRTPHTGYWTPGSAHIVEVPSVQPSGSCKRCVFRDWSDGGLNPHMVTATSDMSLVAEFDDEYAVRLAEVPPLPLLNITWNGTTYQGPAQLFERPGTYTAIVPTPQFTAPGVRYNFTQWSDGYMSNARSAIVPGLGIGCVNLTAMFQEEYAISVSSNPPGLIVGHDGVYGTGPLSFWVVAGTMHTANTSSPQTAGDPDVRYRFNRWVNGPPTLTWTFSADGPATYIAEFIRQIRMTILSNIPGPLFNTSADCGVALPAEGPLTCWADEQSNPTIEAISPPPSPCRLSFLQWSDGNPNPIRTVTPVPPNATYIAFFEVQCTLTVIIDPISCWDAGPPVSSWYPFNTFVKIDGTPPAMPSPYERYRFARWVGTGDGSYSGPDPIANVTVRDAITETAYCFHEFKTVIDTVPSGVVFYYVDDVNYTGPQSFWWLNRSTHWLNVTATTQMSTIAGTRYVFVEWSGVDVSALPRHPPIAVSSSTAGVRHVNFRTQYLMTLLPLDKGNARCAENADCWYNATAPATINVTTPWPSGVAYIRLAFQHWSGDASGTDPTLVISSVDRPMTIVADWAEEYKLTVVTDHGNYACSPDSQCWSLEDTFANVTIVEMIVPGTTGTRYFFDGWTGDVIGMNPFPLKMDSPKNITAVWKVQYQLTISSTCGTDTSCGSPTGAGWYNASDAATLAVTTPCTDSSSKVWDFDRWSGDVGGSQATVTVTMNGPKNVTAMWKEHPTEQAFGGLVVWLTILVIVVVSVALILLLLVRKRRKAGERETESESEPPESEQ